MLSRHQLEGSNKKGTWPHSQLIKLSYLALKRPKTWAWFASCFFSCCLRASVAWSAEGWGGAGLSRAHTRERLRRLTTDKWLVSRSGSPQWVGSTCWRRANIFSRDSKNWFISCFSVSLGKAQLMMCFTFFRLRMSSAAISRSLQEALLSRLEQLSLFLKSLI